LISLREEVPGHEAVVEAMQQRLDQKPDTMRIRRRTVEHPFGTLRFWMGAERFLMKTREHVSTEMGLHVLAYNLRPVMAILGTGAMMQKMRACPVVPPYAAGFSFLA
jgi:hypothetical protein